MTKMSLMGTDGPIEFEMQDGAWVHANPSPSDWDAGITLHICTHCGAKWMNDEESPCALQRVARTHYDRS